LRVQKMAHWPADDLLADWPSKRAGAIPFFRKVADDESRGALAELREVVIIAAGLESLE